MEPGGRTSEEIAKYSFLLGSALRNEDADQFLQIYDAIVPKDLEENEVEDIKFKSRQIADLPEEEYNTLVIDRIRDFSLATSVVSESAAGQGLAMSKSHGMMHSGTDQNSQVNDSYSSHEDDYKRKYLNDTEEENVSAVRNKKPSMQSLSRTSRHFVTKPDTMETEEADSGVFNTSKHTGSSFSDPEFADDSESRGDFDYYPEPFTREQKLKMQKAKQTIVTEGEIKRKNDMAFDGAFEADSDQEDFRFPRDYGRGDPLAEGTELKTYNITEFKGKGTNTGGTIYPFTDYRNYLDSSEDLCEVISDGQLPSQVPVSDYNKEQKEKNTRQYDEAVNADSDDVDDTDNLDSVSVHERLYSGHIAYAPMRSEEEEEYLYDPDSSSKSRHSDSKLEFRSESYQRASHFRRHHPIDHKNVDDKVSFQLASSRNNNKASDPHFPFDYPLDNRKINDSVEKLLPTPGKHIGDVRNMPHAARIYKPNSDGDTKETEQSETNKKKKKKKKTNREDGKDSVDRSTDENGNPLDEGRDIPNRKDTKSSSRDNEKSIYPINSGSFENYTLPRGTKDTNEMQTDKNDKLEEKKKRRQKKKKLEDTTIARNIPGNIGDENIEKLMCFIENSDSKKKKINGSQPNGLPDKNGKKTLKKQHKNSQSSQREEKTVSSESNSEINYDMNSKSNTDTANEKIDISKDKDDTTDLTCKDSIASSESSCDTEDKEGQISHSTVVQSLLKVPKNDFIHTDTEPPIEEEFKVVSKTKKKKKIPANFIPQRDSYRDNSLNIPKQEHRSRRPKRSVTPPPISSATQEVKRKDGTFSPTAFPALGVKPREGRRHSAGSAVEVCQTDSKTEHDDSDLESVKSMPAAGVGSSGSFKNNFDVSHSPSNGGIAAQLRSYATAAASPKVKASSSGVQIQISNSNSEDIGQSVSKTDSEISTESMPGNLIGQEDFPPVSLNPVRDHSHLNNSNSGVKDCSQCKGDGKRGSDTNNTSDLSRARRNLGKDLTNISKTNTSEFPSKRETKNIHIPSNQTQHVEMLSSETVDSVQDNPCSNASKSSLEQNISVSSIVAGNSVKDDKKSCSTSSNNPTQQSMTLTSKVSSTSSSTTNVSKSATNQISKKNKVQSVIFLDKKMNDNSGKLDITFGFDSESFVDNSHVPGPEISFLDCANLECPNSESIKVLNKDMPSVPIAQDNSVIKKCLGMNGISVPIPSQGNCVMISNTTNVNMTYTQEESLPRGGIVEESTEKYQFGDVNQALYNKKDDPNYQRGNFNAEDAISFVYRAWESVIALKESDPKKVMVYSED